jgi:hypothetical protein
MKTPNISHLSPGVELDFNLPKQRTEEGLAYERFYKHIHSLAARKGNGDARIKAANEEIVRCKTLSVSEVQASTVLSEMSVMYANDDYIGLRLMPAFDMGKRSAEYYSYSKRDRFAYPDDEMEVRAQANEVGQGRSRTSVALQGRALKEFVDVTVLNNQDAPLNELMDAQQNVLEGLAFKQELRIASVCTTAGNFGSNTAAIAAADAWNTASGGDPVNDINAAIAACWNGRGPGRKVAACSLDVWNVLKVHPRLLDMIRGNRDGMLSRDMFAQWFELDELLVGKARKDTANEGQTASYSRIWPDTFGVYRVGVTPSKRNAVFGWTFREKPIVQRMWFDPSSGEEGGWYTQASHADNSAIVAADTAYLLTGVIG